MVDLSNLQVGDRVWFYSSKARRNDRWLEVDECSPGRVYLGSGFAIADSGSSIVKNASNGWTIGEIFESQEACTVAVERAARWRRLFGQVSDGLRSLSLEELEAIDEFMRGLGDG